MAVEIIKCVSGLLWPYPVVCDFCLIKKVGCFF